jgi:hypothetical protein
MANEIPTYDFTWQQGDDLEIALVYKTGIDAETATAVDLTGYSCRMDIRQTSVTGSLVYTFNSDDADVLTDDEAILDAEGNINITVPRELSLSGGEIYTAMAGNVTVFYYDLFLRTDTNKQHKIMKGTITVEKSSTLWA